MIKKLLLLTLAATLTMSGAYAQKHKRGKHHKKVSTTEMAVATSAEKWADSVMSKMSLEEKYTSCSLVAG